jgi:hypothetical protein
VSIRAPLTATEIPDFIQREQRNVVINILPVCLNRNDTSASAAERNRGDG